ncbi:hypothetical protein HBB16_01855 [Pseudonocardia sp. MCCB 268]|nr:hypothetical protein [Pseudonocardia cytotoxica]
MPRGRVTPLARRRRDPRRHLTTGVSAPTLAGVLDTLTERRCCCSRWTMGPATHCSRAPDYEGVALPLRPGGAAGPARSRRPSTPVAPRACRKGTTWTQADIRQRDRGVPPGGPARRGLVEEWSRHRRRQPRARGKMPLPPLIPRRGPVAGDGRFPTGGRSCSRSSSTGPDPESVDGDRCRGRPVDQHGGQRPRPRSSTSSSAAGTTAAPGDGRPLRSCVTTAPVMTGSCGTCRTSSSPTWPACPRAAPSCRTSAPARRRRRPVCSHGSRGHLCGGRESTRLLELGDPATGRLGRQGLILMGYLGDRDKTERTFPTVEGVRTVAAR